MITAAMTKKTACDENLPQLTGRQEGMTSKCHGDGDHGINCVGGEAMTRWWLLFIY